VSDPVGPSRRLWNASWLILGTCLLLWLAVQVILQIWLWLVVGVAVTALLWGLSVWWRRRRDRW
jgi:membrane protein DedA with SNARE-associated domain